MGFFDIFDESWEGLTKIFPGSFTTSASAIGDFMSAADKGNNVGMMAAVQKLAQAWTFDPAMGAVQAVTKFPGIKQGLEAYDAVRAHVLVRPVTTLMLMGERADAYSSGKTQWSSEDLHAESGYMFNAENWRKAWNDSQFVTAGQAATWGASYLFMSKERADQLDPGTFTGRAYYTGAQEAATRAALHPTNMFDESGAKDREAYQRYLEDMARDPEATDAKFAANSWLQYSSGALDFGAAFIDIPFIGWGKKLLGAGKLGNIAGRLGSPGAAEKVLGRTEEVLSRLDADAAARGLTGGNIVEQIGRAESRADAALGDKTTAAALAIAQREAADLSELSPMAQKLYTTAQNTDASTFQRLAVANNSHGGLIASVMTTLAKHKQVHNFADFYAAVYGDQRAWARLQANAPDVAVAIGRGQNTFNLTTSARRYGLDAFATDIGNAMRDTQFDAHVDALMRTDGIWGDVVSSQVAQPLVRVRTGNRIAHSIHQFALAQPPVIYTGRTLVDKPIGIVAKGLKGLAAKGPSFGYARDINLNDLESFKDFRANLERAGDLITPQQREQWVSAYMAQPNAAQRSQIVAHVEELLYREIGQRLSLTPDQVRDVMRVVTAKRAMASSIISESRAYMPTTLRTRADQLARQGRADDAARLYDMADAYEVAVKRGQVAGWIRRTLDDQANLVIVEENARSAIFDADVPVLASQNADFLPMTDWRMLRSAAKRYIMPKARMVEARKAREAGRAAGTYDPAAESIAAGDRLAVAKYEAGQSALGFIEAVNKTWSTLAVMRPAHTPRTLADDTLRRAVVHGEFPIIGSAARGVYRWGRNRVRTSQLRSEAWQAERVRKRASGTPALLPVASAPTVTAAPIPGQVTAAGRPRAIDRFNGMALTPEEAAQLAGRYQWTSGDIDTHVPPFTAAGVTTYSTFEEAFANGHLTREQFLGAIVHGYREGTLPADYVQILDSIGSRARGRHDAYNAVLRYALDRVGMSAYTNPKFATDIYEALYDLHHNRATDAVADRAQVVADPLTGVWGPPTRALHADYEVAGFQDIKPDVDFARLASEEARLARTATAKAGRMTAPDPAKVAQIAARKVAAETTLQETEAAELLAQTALGEAEAAVAVAATSPARRAAQTALRRAQRSLDRAAARSVKARERRDMWATRHSEATAASGAVASAQAAAAFHVSRAAMSAAHQSVGNIGYAYDFEVPEKLVEKYMSQIVTEGAKLGFTLRPDGSIRVSVLVPAGVDVQPVKVETAEKTLREWASKLADSGNTGFRITENGHTIDIEGGFFGAAGEGARATVGARSPEETWAAREMTRAADKQIAAAIGRGAWRPTITPQEAAYAPAWERAVNLELGNDAVARKFLAGWSEARVLDWVESSAEGRKWLNQNTMDRAFHWEQVAGIGRFVHELVPAGIRDKALGQSVTIDDLAKVLPDKAQWPDVHGEALTLATGTNPAMRYIKKGVDGWFKWLVNKPTDKLVRYPFFAESYNNHVAELARTYLRQLKPGETVSQSEIERLQQIARDRAMFEVRRFLYDTAFKTDAAAMFSKFMPFANAQADAVFKWARIVREKPVESLSVASRWWLQPERLGLIQDQDGNQLVYEPRLNGEQERWVDPMTGEEVTGKDGVGKERMVVFRLPSGLSPESYNGHKVTVRFNQDSANVFLAWPTAGPWLSIPFNEFVLRTDTKLGDNPIVNQFVLPFGPQADIAKTALPGLLRTAWEQFDQDDTDYAYETMSNFAQQQVDYSMGRRRERPSLEDAHDMSRTMKGIRFLASAFLPVSAQFDSPYAPYVDYYKRLVAKHGGDKQAATDEFVANAGQDAVELTYAVTRNLKGIPSTAEAWQKYDELRDLVDKYPEWAGMLTGSAGASLFSKSVYERQKRAGMRASFTSEESAAEVNKRTTWSKYAGINSLIMAKLHERGLRSLNQRGAEDLALFKRQWVNYNKFWYGPNGEVELSPWYQEYYARSSQTLQRLTSAVQLVQDERLQGRDEIRGLIDYLNLRGQYVRYLRGNGFSSINAAKAQPIKTAWDVALHGLLDRNLSFQTVHSYYLEADDLSFDLNFEQLLSHKTAALKALEGVK